MPHVWDQDEELLAALREALPGRPAPPARDQQARPAGPAVPPEFIAAGQALYTWRSIDAELAELSYDSAQDSLARAGQRAGDPSVRTLTFSSDHLTIELEADSEAILGQLVPPQAGLVEIQSGPGKGTETSVDAMGFFTIQPAPGGPFRLRCQGSDGVVVLTEWLRL